ncbi:RNA-binding protein Cwf29 [Malassezia brasiliensis]|uniref:RNA-binding protein Cwf29 n=1 Tax=Malassezia brasiliensis TaxID=1821822 RepID=A0AAF0DUH0_9BASI|nr:RNA-binding protein Cwf29 [Malassezia brasiliensis]
MNSIRDIQRRNEQELELGLVGSGSWHEQYKDSAYIYVGGLPYDLTEGDVITIFSQFGEVVNIHLPRPRDDAPRDDRARARPPEADAERRPKHRGFGFLMYEDQRSTILAVDNLNGAQVLGRTLRVDHVLNYKPERVPDAEGNLVEPDEQTFNCAPPETIVDDDADADDDIDLSDPMAAYFAEEKKRKRRERRERHEHRSKERRRDERRRDERRRDDGERRHRTESERERHERHKRERRERHARSERGASPRGASPRGASPGRGASPRRDTPRTARQDTPPRSHSPRAPADGDVTPPYRRGVRTDTP